MENWKNKKILIAEDEMSNYMYISTILDDTGIQIQHAENGKIAVELCINGQFDVIFMDIKMPVMDGFDATKEIRKFNKDIAIIAQTAFAYKREECIAGGFTDYIAKPYSQKQLIKMLGQYLDK